MFDPTSRYYSLTPYTVTDARGRTVQVVPVPPPPLQNLLGYHLLKKGQRIDHLAYRYIKDPDASWRISEMNDVMQQEILTEQSEIAIPQISS